MLTDYEKDQVAYHLGYPLVSQGTGGVGVNWPLAATVFPVHAALNHLLGTAEERIRNFLAAMDSTEAQILDANKRLKASAVGDIDLRKDEIPALEAAYKTWQRRLSTLVGVAVNSSSPTGGGVNGTRVC